MESSAMGGSSDAVSRAQHEHGRELPVPGPKLAVDAQAGEWAICCSGGGIRSASYCLGALQGMQGTTANGLFARVRHIVSVSGGSYIAASRALVAGGLPDGGGPAYGPGSPEEENLRDNTHYLAPNGRTVLVGVLSLLVGVVATFLLVFAPLFVAGHVWGWLLRWQKVLCPGSVQRCGAPGPLAASVTSLVWWWLLPVIAGGLTLLSFGWWWWTLKPRRNRERQEGRGAGEAGQQESGDRGDVLAKVTGWAALVTTVLAVVMFVVPLLLAGVARLPDGAFKSLVYDLGFGVGQKWTPAALAGAFAALIAIAQSCRAKLAQLQLPGSQGKPASQTKAQTQQQGAASPGLLASIGGRIRTYLLPWLASAVIVLAAVVAGLRWVKDGTAAGYSAGQLWPVLIAVGVMLATRVMADVNRISVHDFYRWRLASAYAVRRGSGHQRVLAVPGALLSSLAEHPGQPELVICATANINADRDVPPGRGGMLVAFDPERVTLRGDDPAHSAAARTADYECLVGNRRFTLFDISAISGAAVSPLMGSATRQAYRILLTMTNVRLGVWVPHPAVVAAARGEADRQQQGTAKPDRWWQAAGLLLWYAFPWHPRWGRGEGGPGGPSRGEARLWAYVLRMRNEPTWPGRLIAASFYHALQPTLGMLWAEAGGHASYRQTWICLTDGGHYDNLGLVEALQRNAEKILVLDASGDKADTWNTLGGAIALAKTDAGINVELDPAQMRRGQPGAGQVATPLAAGEVVRPWARGTFSSIAGWRGSGAADGQMRPGTLWVCKLGWWAGAPWDIQAYARQHREFPGQSTMQQLYDGAEFDAYRVLGLSAVTAALDGEPPLPPPGGQRAAHGRGGYTSAA